MLRNTSVLQERSTIFPDNQFARCIENEREVAINVSGREIKENRIIIRLGHATDSFIYRVGHSGIFFHVGKLPDNQASYPAENTAQAEVLHHTVNGIRMFANVLYEENIAFCNATSEWRLLQTVNEAEVAAPKHSFRLASPIERMGRQRVVERPAEKQVMQAIIGFLMDSIFGKIFAHAAVNATLTGMAQ